MIYTKEELITLFENSGVIVKTDKGYMVNSVFQKSVKANKRAGKCDNYPTAFNGLSDMLIYNKVVLECNVPSMYKGDISYFVRTQTKKSVSVLKEILNDPAIDFDIFVEKTTSFYASDMAVPGFAKYLTEGTWRSIYDTETERRVSKGIF